MSKHSGKKPSDHHSDNGHHYGNSEYHGGSGTTYTLTGSTDSMIGGNGADIFIATTDTLSSGDVIDGGAGKNVLSLSGTGTFNMQLPTTLNGIQTVRGDASAAQTVTLRDGIDLKFTGGHGNNIVTAGTTGDQEIKLGNGNNTVIGGSGSDEIQVGSGNNTITAGSGQTEIKLGSGINTVSGGSGTLEIKTSNGTDTILGGTGSLKICAGSGTTSVTSSSGDDWVAAGKGTLTFTGTSGNDTLALGKGTVNATLGSGNDTILATHGHGNASISGFAQGSDKIDLHKLHIDDFTELQTVATITTDADSTTITFADGPVVDLIGITSVSTTDFVFA